MEPDAQKFERAEYDWQDPNPSVERGLPFIQSHLFDASGACHWIAQRTYDNENALTLEIQYLRSKYQNFFTLLEHTEYVYALPAIFNEPDGPELYVDYYQRGATIGLLALINSVDDDIVIADVTDTYLEDVGNLEAIDVDWWLHRFSVYANKHTEQLRGFILKDYLLFTESRVQRTAVLAGAMAAYTWMSHSAACIQREKEICWMTRDDESFEGWLAYRFGEQ